MNLSNIKRIWMITDTHLGVHNSSLEWMEIIKEYFNEFFIPLLKKEKKEGDILIHLGDVFDSRHSLNLLVMNEGISIFEQISKIMPIIIILGNHDIYKKNSNDINSVKILKWIPNIKVCEEPEIILASGKRLLMMPWRANHQEEITCIKQNPADFLFCHTDVQGLKFNKSIEVQGGISLEDVKHFRKVFSGHIHYSQKKGNFIMLGCPYSLTRSDINNEKGIWRFDIETEKEEFFFNSYSPKFIRIMLEKVLEMEEIEAKELFKNNFVDILVDQKWILNFPFTTFYDNISGYRKLEFVPMINDNDDEDYFNEETTQIGKIDIIELAQKIINNTSHSEVIKNKLFNTIKILYEKVQKSQKEKDNEEL